MWAHPETNILVWSNSRTNLAIKTRLPLATGNTPIKYMRSGSQPPQLRSKFGDNRGTKSELRVSDQIFSNENWEQNHTGHLDTAKCARLSARIFRSSRSGERTSSAKIFSPGDGTNSVGDCKIDTKGCCVGVVRDDGSVSESFIPQPKNDGSHRPVFNLKLLNRYI